MTGEIYGFEKGFLLRGLDDSVIRNGEKGKELYRLLSLIVL